MDLTFLLLVSFIVLILVTLIIVRYFSASHGVLKDLGIVTPTPSPLLGNFGITAKLGIFNVQTEYYRKFKDQKVYGWYEGRFPVIVVKDLDIIRDVFTKHFNSFRNRRNLYKPEPPLDEMLVLLRDEHWKQVRVTISPTFSSGRIKKMSQHVERNAKRFVENLREKQESNEEVELKNVCSCFTLDVIASTGFGLDINSLKDPNNDFAVSTKKITTPSVPLLLIALFLPELSKYMQMLGLSLFPPKPIEYLVKVIKSTTESRKAQGQMGKVHDFLDLLMEASDSEGTEKLTTSEMHAQAIMFILAGYETASQAMSFTLFLLAVHPECCQKVVEEIQDTIGDQPPNYDNVQSLNYLEACINESLRLFPPTIFTDRMCTEDLTIQGIHFPKDVALFIPLFAIHRDPEFWPDPEKFQPDRFSPENRNTRHPFAHLPFGQGPRMCMGMRLVLLELKVAIASVLQKFELVSCDKTVYPIKLNKMLLKAEDGLWVKVETRKYV